MEAAMKSLRPWSGGFLWWFLVAFLIAVLLVACGGGGGGGGSTVSDEVPVELGLPGPGDPLNYVPLSVGNLWLFGGTVTTNWFTNTYRSATSVSDDMLIEDRAGVILHEVDTHLLGAPVASYLVKDPNGVANFGSDDPDPFSAALTEYWQVRFPFAAGERFVQFDRQGIDFGEDLDQDGRNETADVYAVVSVSGFEDVTVPAGTFLGAARVTTHATLSIRLSSSRDSVAATADETSWYAPGVGWVKKESSLSLLGEGEQILAELQAYIVEDQSAGIIEVAPGLPAVIDGLGSSVQPRLYAFDVNPGEHLTVAMTGLTDQADLFIYSPDNIWIGNSPRSGTDPEDYQLTTTGQRLVAAVTGPDSAAYTLSVAATPTVASPENEGSWERPVVIPPDAVTPGQVAARGTSYYAVTGLPAGRHTVSMTALSEDADLHVFYDETYSMERDCTLRGYDILGTYPDDCTLDDTSELYFSVSSGPLNTTGATYNILVH
jgi:hypothetical protein